MSDQVSEHDGQAEQAESKRDRQKRRRQERAAQQEQHRRRQKRQRTLVTVVVGIVAVAAVFALAMLIAGSGDGSGDGSDSGGGSGGTSAEDVPAASVDGSGLSAIPGDGGDPAVGSDAPDVTGQSFAGEATTLGTAQDPAQAVVFLAHWCPHCQREIPEVVQWVEDGIVPSDVELVAVSTLHRPQQGNWPPDQWLADESWPGQVLADPDNSVARAYGMQATPSWVFIDSDGDIAQRVSGRMSRDQLESALNGLSS